MGIIQKAVIGALILPICLGGIEVIYNEIGCFRDASSRHLNGPMTIFDDNTPEKCGIYCSMHGYDIAGVEFGRECFCGNSYGKHESLAQSECNMRCPGDQDEYCGGIWAINIYNMLG